MFLHDDRHTAPLVDRLIAGVIGGFFGYWIGLVVALGIDALFGSNLDPSGSWWPSVPRTPLLRPPGLRHFGRLFGAPYPAPLVLHADLKP